MARRFSQLFVLPSRSKTSATSYPFDGDNKVSPSEDRCPKKGRKRDTIKDFAAVLFSSGRPRGFKDRPAVKVTRLLPTIPPESPLLRHDSGIGSEKSSTSTSIKSLPIQPLQSTLSPEYYHELQILVQTLETLLQNQDAMSHSLAKNLLGLMAVKELHIKANRRLQPEWKAGLIMEMNAVRDELCVLFAKKATVQRRSLALVSKLKLGGGGCGCGCGRGCGVGVKATLDRVKRDVVYQGILSEGVIDAITRKCWKSRWVRSTNHGLETKRFVGFVVGRVSRLHALSREVEGVMAEVQRLNGRVEAC